MRTAVVFLVAVAVRLAHVWAVRGTPLFDVLMGDARGYDAWATRLAAGDWIGAGVFYQAPLYPYFLGLLYALVGRDLLLVRIVQALVGAAAAVLLAGAAERLFSRRVAWVAGLGLALYAPAIFFDVLLQKTVLDVFFICLTLWVASQLVEESNRPRLWAALGATLGALSLTRENALALVPVAIIWALSTRRAHEGQEGKEGHRGRPAPDVRQQRLGVLRVPVVTLLLGLTLVLLPVGARNYAVDGGLYVTTSQFGANFFIGNNPAADGTYMSLRPGRGAPEFERQDATELAEQALGRALTPAEVSAYWRDRALGFIAAEPGRWAALMARKVALLWNATEMLDTESQESYEEISPILDVLAPAGHFGILVPLGLAGLVVAWPDRRRLWPVLGFAGVYAASVVVFFVFARYRFPLVPFLLLFAALGVVSAPALITRGSAVRRGAIALAVAVAALAANWPLLSRTRMRAITETNLGTALYEAGRLDEAVARYEKAVALQPDYAPAYNNLGVTLRASGQVDAAIAAYERGLQHARGYADLHYNLANALLSQNRADEAAAHLKTSLAGEPDSAANHNNLGSALADTGQFAPAVAEFRAAIALDPASVLAHRNLGNALAAMGRAADARQALERAVALAPGDPDANYDLGSLLLEAGAYGEAAARFRAALASRPRDARALNNLGIALASQGRIRDAAALFEQALAIEPDLADAQRNLATARKALK
jgi:tetratricopeptide (TPR) repeat protein